MAPTRPSVHAKGGRRPSLSRRHKTPRRVAAPRAPTSCCPCEIPAAPPCASRSTTTSLATARRESRTAKSRGEPVTTAFCAWTTPDGKTMELNDVMKWLNDAGFAFQWRSEPNVHGASAILRPKNGKKLSLGALEVAIVIPDVHLGVGNDVFSTADPTQTNSSRLLEFLQALASLRDEVGEEKIRVVQVGDWYDFFRSLAPTVYEHVAAIE